MQQPQLQTPSESDLYGTDEIEFLLDEIRDLEPVCCQLDDVQDFEIAGSRAGELSLSLESPLGTCTSWDSHANYRHSSQSPLAWGVVLHCDSQHLKTPTGIVRILLVLSSAACLACECSAGTVQVGLFLLPLIGRLRLMIFCAVFSLLITCVMLFLDISHIALMFPFNWTKVNTWMYLSIGLFFILGSTLLLHMVIFADEFSWVPKHTKETLFASAIIGYVCAVEAFILSGLAKWPQHYRQVPDDGSEMYIEDREMILLSTAESTEVPNHNSTPHSETNHHNQCNRISSSSSCNQKPYIPVVGCIDGTHLYFQRPRENENIFFNRKGRHSLNAMIACDHKMRIMAINTRYGGSAHDSLVWKHSNERSFFVNSFNERDHSCWLLAKRPDQANNKRPTLGQSQTRKSNHRYREGYHYQPIASTSRMSPTFVLDEHVTAGPSTSRSIDNSSS